MPQYQTPRVYYERLDASAPAISAVRTDVVGFVGIAGRGPLDTPIPIESWRQFEAHFGGFTGAGFLAYTVRAFFENGGRRCWVVRVASRQEAGGARPASVLVRLLDPDPISEGLPAWRIAASSPGIWGNALSATLRETHQAQTLSVPARSTPEAVAVHTTSGFARYTMVRLSQDEAETAFKVVSEVDAGKGLLHWVNPKPGSRLPFDSPLRGFDLAQPILLESVEYTLLVREVGRLVGRYAGLSLVPEHPRYGPRVLAPLEQRLRGQTDQRTDGAQGQSQAPVNLFSSLEQRGQLPPTPERVVIEEMRKRPVLDFQPLALEAGPVVLKGGTDGLRFLRHNDFMGEEVDPRDSDRVKTRKQRGFRALDLVDEVAVVAVPDLHIQPVSAAPRQPRVVCVPDPCFPEEDVVAPTRQQLPRRTEDPPRFGLEEIFEVQQTLVQHCERRRDRIALLDPPVEAALDEQGGVSNLMAWRTRFDSDFAVLFWPWLRLVDPLVRRVRPGGRLTRDVPPSGHVAGQIARSDLEIGVHKAPANTALGWVQDITLAADDALHGLLNTDGINVIRTLPGRGIRIMGARTLSSNVQWRFLNVRRLLLMIAKAIDLSTQWAVFEPNDEFTRAKLRLALFSFLFALWQRGALVGGTADAAFSVKCDEENNPSFERDRGRLFADVSVAPSQPYEFIVLRVGRTDNEFEISESVSSMRGV